jgi:type II secretory pathway pseudopilin PulG
MKSRRNGFTILELTLASGVLGVLGLAVASVAVAMSNASEDSDNYYAAIQNGRSTLNRAQAVARKAKLVTALTADSIVFWTGDANGDGLINLDELLLVTYDSKAHEIRQQYVSFKAAPANVALAMNVNVTLSSATSVTTVGNLFNTAATYKQTDVLASDVLSCSLAAAPAPPMATTVTIQFSVGTSRHPLALSSFARLRADATASVSQVGGQWVLTAISTQ